MHEGGMLLLLGLQLQQPQLEPPQLDLEPEAEVSGDKQAL